MTVLSMVLLALAGGTVPSAAIAGFFMFKVNRATAIKVLAEAEDVSKTTAIAEARAAIDFAHEAYQAVKRDCDDCKKRLGRAEERQARAEQRMHLAEERLVLSEQRERRVLTTLRAIVRVMDGNDATQIDAAITAARELI